MDAHLIGWLVALGSIMGLYLTVGLILWRVDLSEAIAQAPLDLAESSTESDAKTGPEAKTGKHWTTQALFVATFVLVMGVLAKIADSLVDVIYDVMVGFTIFTLIGFTLNTKREGSAMGLGAALTALLIISQHFLSSWMLTNLIVLLFCLSLLLTWRKTKLRTIANFSIFMVCVSLVAMVVDRLVPGLFDRPASHASLVEVIVPSSLGWQADIYQRISALCILVPGAYVLVAFREAKKTGKKGFIVTTLLGVCSGWGLAEQLAHRFGTWDFTLFPVVFGAVMGYMTSAILHSFDDKQDEVSTAAPEPPSAASEKIKGN